MSTDRDPAARRAHLQRVLARYLERHPHAGDTRDGILSSWLPDSGCEDAPIYIDDVLKNLVASGELIARPLPDGSVLYVRGRRS